MRSNPSKKRHKSMKKVARLMGTAAAIVPMAMSVPMLASADSGAPVVKSHISSVLANQYSSSLVAGNSFTIDLTAIFQNAGELAYTVLVQNKAVADVSVTGTSLRIGLKKTGVTNVDLMALRGGERVHERFKLTVSPNYALNSSGTASVGDVVRYYKAHAADFQTTDDYRRLLQAAVSSSAPAVNHRPAGTVETPPVELELGATTTLELSDFFSDEDGDELSYSLSENAPSSGAFASAEIYGSQLVLTANRESSEGMQLTVQAKDSQYTAETTFRLTVAHVNHAPTAQNVSVTAIEATFYIGDLKGSDVDGDRLTYVIKTNPEHGSIDWLDQSSGKFKYTPATGWTGNDSFTYYVSDGTEISATATVSIQVKPRLIKHEIGAENKFDLRSSQTATIDLSQMFVYGDSKANVLYDVALGTNYGSLSDSLEGAYLTLNAGGSPSAVAVTVKASNDGGVSWDSQVLTVKSVNGARLADQTFGNTETSYSVNLADYFNGSYIYNYTCSANVLRGSATASVAGKTLTLGLAQNDYSTIRVQASDGRGLTISGKFNVTVGIPVINIGTQYMAYDEKERQYRADIDLTGIFPAARSFRVTDYDSQNIDSIWEPWGIGKNEWTYASNLVLVSENEFSGQTAVQVEGRDEDGNTASYTIMLRQNTAPYVTEFDSSAWYLKTPLFLKQGETLQLHVVDEEDDPLTTLEASEDDDEGEVEGTLFDVQTAIGNGRGVVTLKGIHSGVGNLFVYVSDGLPGGEGFYNQQIIVYQDELVRFQRNQLYTSLNISRYLDGLDSSDLEIHPLRVEISANSLVADVAMNGKTVQFKAVSYQGYEAPQPGTGEMTLTITDWKGSSKIIKITVYSPFSLL